MTGTASSVAHRHGRHIHRHPDGGRLHRHVLFPRSSKPVADRPVEGRHDAHDRSHSHGLVDRSIVRSRAGVRAVLVSLAVLTIAAGVQAAIFVVSGSVALLADLVHNVGDALTAVPLGIAFVLRSERAERWAGYFVVLAIFVSACVAFYESLMRLIHPEAVSHLWALAAAGAVGFVGNEIAAVVRLRAGARLDSPALVADGYHARTDGVVSLGVVASAALVAFGAEAADPLIGLAITVVILRVTWQSWQTIRHGAHGDHGLESTHEGRMAGTDDADAREIRRAGADGDDLL